MVASSVLTKVGSVSKAGAIYVWAGGPTLTGSPAPTATLTVPGAVQGDRLGDVVGGQGVQIEDLTGDGILDILAGASYATVGGVPAAGAMYLWSGGPTLAGRVAPSATMAAPGACANDSLGAPYGPFGQAILLVEVTGDDVLDVVATVPTADFGGVANTGALYIWAGGCALTGTIPPTAILTRPRGLRSHLLGSMGSFPASFDDVTGDGILDVVTGSPRVDTSVREYGTVYLWSGGPGLTGIPAPTATLTVGVQAMGLGDMMVGPGLLVDDVTGDGLLDVVVGAQNASSVFQWAWSCGAVYVWAGGPTLIGTPAPTALLQFPESWLGYRLGDLWIQGMYLVDVTADGIADVVVGATEGSHFWIASGAIHVWAGGAGLTGRCAPTATLRVTGGSPNDRLGSIEGQAILFADVTGDGLTDIVAGTEFATIDGKEEAGGIYVWRGGSGLRGQVASLASLVAPGAYLDQLGKFGVSQGILLADVTGDGRLDVLAGASLADRNQRRDVGALYVWAGGPSLAGVTRPTATLAVPDATAGDELGAIHCQGVLLGDLNDDDVLDVCAASYRASVRGLRHVGAAYVWFGGQLSGDVAPAATLTDPGATALVRLCALEKSTSVILGRFIGGQGLQLADVNGDGVVDILALTALGNGTRGAIFLRLGGSTLSGVVGPSRMLAVPGAFAGDSLGY